MMGGLLCERRHSDTAAAKLAAVRASSAHASHAATSFDASRMASSAALCPQIDEEEPEEYVYVYSHKRVQIAGSSYEYIDSPRLCVGHGSYGTVFKGVDRRSGTAKPVAVKKMASSMVKPGELEALKRVRNPHLVMLIDICDELDHFTYLIMELMDSDLDRHLKWDATDGRLTNEDLRTVIDSLARGYYALYEQHVVHRDIKPQNILLNYNRKTGAIDTAKITDFGVSRVLENSDSQMCNVTGLAGTFYYMAPEVGANVLTTSAYDHSVDIWSIGCVIYQCLVGEMPFDEGSLCRVFLYCACSNYEAYDMPVLPEETDEDIQRMLTSLLEIDRDKRATPVELYKAVVKSSPKASPDPLASPETQVVTAVDE
ncbi:Protein T07F12.4 [Aphelenchoides avenae]|nr:Protein T07F12.4 [Aphelenchus avenae]